MFRLIWLINRSHIYVYSESDVWIDITQGCQYARPCLQSSHEGTKEVEEDAPTNARACLDKVLYSYNFLMSLLNPVLLISPWIHVLKLYIYGINHFTFWWFSCCSNFRTHFYITNYSICRNFIQYCLLLETLNCKNDWCKLKKKSVTHFPIFCKFCDTQEKKDIHGKLLYDCGNKCLHSPSLKIWCKWHHHNDNSWN